MKTIFNPQNLPSKEFTFCLSVFPLSLFLIMFFQINSFLHACPVYKKGNIRVVDEKGKSISNAIIWKIYSNTDSFRLKKGVRYRRSDDTIAIDTSFFEIWSSFAYRRKNSKPFSSYFRVHAAGYADVVIEYFDFSKTENKYDEESTINIKMQTSLFIKKGDEFIKITEFRLEKATAAKDTTTISLNEFVNTLKQETSLEAQQRKERALVSTYPNPASDFIRIEIRDSMPLPYNAMLYDLNGKCVGELQLTEPINNFDLQYFAPGVYMVMVRKHDGEILYCSKFTKI